MNPASQDRWTSHISNIPTIQCFSLNLSNLRIRQWFPVPLVSTLGCLHSLDVSSIAAVTEVYTASIFRIEVGRMGKVSIYIPLFKRNIDASPAPIGTVELRTFSLSTLPTYPEGTTAPHMMFLKEDPHKHGNPPILHTSTLEMEAACTSETSAILLISSWFKDPTAESTLAV